MKGLVLALILMMVSSTFAMKATGRFEMHKQGDEERKPKNEYEEADAVWYPGSSVNNHHYIPRQDFNNGDSSYSGSESGNNG